MRAGKMIIGNYSSKAVDLLLPELLNGMTDERWRIRVRRRAGGRVGRVRQNRADRVSPLLLQQSSVSLTGELLFKISGISGKAEIEVEDGAETSAGDSSRKALLEALGPEKRDKVLSALYVIRQDAVGAVRTASVHIWKALVQSESPQLLAFADRLAQPLTFTVFGPFTDTPRTRSSHPNCPGSRGAADLWLAVLSSSTEIQCARSCPRSSTWSSRFFRAPAPSRRRCVNRGDRA
jgi:hypothetical protein